MITRLWMRPSKYFLPMSMILWSYPRIDVDDWIDERPQLRRRSCWTSRSSWWCWRCRGSWLYTVQRSHKMVEHCDQSSQLASSGVTSPMTKPQVSPAVSVSCSKMWTGWTWMRFLGSCCCSQQHRSLLSPPPCSHYQSACHFACCKYICRTSSNFNCTRGEAGRIWEKTATAQRDSSGPFACLLIL